MLAKQSDQNQQELVQGMHNLTVGLSQPQGVPPHRSQNQTGKAPCEAPAAWMMGDTFWVDVLQWETGVGDAKQSVVIQL